MQLSEVNEGIGVAMHPNHGSASAPMPGAPVTGRSGWSGRKWMQSLRRVLNSQAGFLLLYALITHFVGLFVGLLAQLEWNILADPDESHRSIEYIVEHTDAEYAGTINLVMGLCGLVFLVLMRRRQIADGGPTGIFHRSRYRMTWSVFLGCFLLLFSAQIIAGFYGMGLDWTTEVMGLDSIRTTSDIIEAAGDTLPMLAYTCFVAPVVEEILFRGAILNSLKPYGKVFAIVTTSAMFGFFHGDLAQGLFAFVVGLVLGYLSCEYSIFWSILLHISNNLIVSNLLGPWISGLDGNVADLVALMLLIACFVGLIVVPSLSERRIRAFVMANRTYSNAYGSWSAPWFVVLLITEGMSMLYLLLS
ncbi:putative CAAX amino terminal protease family [Bifidobacterium coryneforme]|uniref:CAAX amino terminal protease family n=1 Tax=Bifidobacterium coryneforme TaxID=1687 RepID=A0ABD4AG47_9BIFI|nr:putative CAAX amino terminal protease family [Bifidobacterium coryneforme]